MQAYALAVTGYVFISIVAMIAVIASTIGAPAQSLDAMQMIAYGMQSYATTRDACGMSPRIGDVFRRIDEQYRRSDPDYWQYTLEAVRADLAFSGPLVGITPDTMQCDLPRQYVGVALSFASGMVQVDEDVLAEFDDLAGPAKGLADEWKAVDEAMQMLQNGGAPQPVNPDWLKDVLNPNDALRGHGSNKIMSHETRRAWENLMRPMCENDPNSDPECPEVLGW